MKVNGACRRQDTGESIYSRRAAFLLNASSSRHFFQVGGSQQGVSRLCRSVFLSTDINAMKRPPLRSPIATNRGHSLPRRIEPAFQSRIAVRLVAKKTEAITFARTFSAKMRCPSDNILIAPHAALPHSSACIPIWRTRSAHFSPYYKIGGTM